jgi:hypothetical protein
MAAAKISGASSMSTYGDKASMSEPAPTETLLGGFVLDHNGEWQGTRACKSNAGNVSACWRQLFG